MDVYAGGADPFRLGLELDNDDDDDDDRDTGVELWPRETDIEA